ncbi:MAG: gliding motility lipoprotein GldH [Prevotella sp.]|nr:gliding motility lipoprotein GldH [Prevotella sp.]MBR4698647.1 gliding motility lipoprotein GldH [Prevotella sp.]
MKKRRFDILALLTLLTASLLLGACIGNKVYDHYEHVPLTGWEKNDTLIFSIPKSAITGGNYIIDLGLRINPIYPFTGLTLVVEQTVFRQTDNASHILFRQQTDTLACKLIDERGNAQGAGVSHFQYQFNVSEMPLQPTDSLHIRIRHDMKREILPGIAEIGIQLHRE